MHHEPIEGGLAFLPALFPSFVPADYLFREALEREDEQIQFWQRSLLTEHDQFVFSLFQSGSVCVAHLSVLDACVVSLWF